MTVYSSYAFVVAVSYAAVYVLAILITSIICAVKVSSNRKSTRNIPIKITNNNKDIQLSYYALNEDTKNVSKDKTCCSLILIWFKLLLEKKKIYFKVIPHIFDTATDVAVIIQYYEMWKYPNTNTDDIDAKLFFTISVFILTFHRIISSILLLKLTKSFTDFVLQLLELLMLKAIWINYKLGTKKPTNPARYLQSLEATFESSPQILLSLAFIIQSSRKVNVLIILSLLNSFWSISSVVMSDDCLTIHTIWTDINLHKYCYIPCVHPCYILHKLARFMEITTRVGICMIIWLYMGGKTLLVILIIEFIWCLLCCYAAKSIGPLSQMMYLAPSFGNSYKDSICCFMVIYMFWYYRALGSMIYLFTALYFVFNIYDESEQDYVRRHNVEMDDFTMYLFIYCGIAMLIWPYIEWFMFKNTFLNGRTEGSTARDIKKLIHERNFADVVELLEFGMKLTKTMCIKPYENPSKWRINDTLLDVVDCVDICKDHLQNNLDYNWLIILRIILLIDFSFANNKHLSHKLQSVIKDRNADLIHLSVLMTTLPEYVDRYSIYNLKTYYKKGNSLLALKYFVEKRNGDINCVDNGMNSALHYIAKDTKLSLEDVENIQYLLEHGIDTTIQNAEEQTAYDILVQRSKVKEHAIFSKLK
eukprot:121146_1